MKWISFLVLISIVSIALSGCVADKPELSSDEVIAITKNEEGPTYLTQLYQTNNVRGILKYRWDATYQGNAKWSVTFLHRCRVDGEYADIQVGWYFYEKSRTLERRGYVKHTVSGPEAEWEGISP